MEAKILIYDIETTGYLGYSYGVYDTNLYKIIEQPIMLSFSYTWYTPGKKGKIINRGLIDTSTFTSNPKDDKELVQELWSLFNEADIILGHNSFQFDDKMARMFFLKHGLEPTSPAKSVDTKKAAKAIGRFGSNSLNNLSEFFGFGHKEQIGHADLWWDCLLGDKKAWKLMKQYNEQDVSLTVKLYEKLRPWMTNHPSLSVLNDNPDTCPKCGGPNIKPNGGYFITKTGKRKRYKCNDCGGWSSGRLVLKTDVKYVN